MESEIAYECVDALREALFGMRPCVSFAIVYEFVDSLRGALFGLNPCTAYAIVYERIDSLRGALIGLKPCASLAISHASYRFITRRSFWAEAAHCLRDCLRIA